MSFFCNYFKTFAFFQPVALPILAEILIKCDSFGQKNYNRMLKILIPHNPGLSSPIRSTRSNPTAGSDN